MAYDFPSTGLTFGQLYPTSPAAGQYQYTWDGEKWTMDNVVEVEPPEPPAAPVLALMTGPSDNTPNFNLTADFAIGDVVRYQWDTVNTFASGAFDEATNTIDAGEDAAMMLDFDTGSLANGIWYFRARVERGATIFAWSNTATQTISA